MNDRQTPEEPRPREPEAESGPDVSDAPDALFDPDIDEVLGSDVRHEAGTGESEKDPYEMRSMPPEPHGTDDDPASYVNP